MTIFSLKMIPFLQSKQDPFCEDASRCSLAISPKTFVSGVPDGKIEIKMTNVWVCLWKNTSKYFVWAGTNRGPPTSWQTFEVWAGNGVFSKFFIGVTLIYNVVGFTNKHYVSTPLHGKLFLTWRKLYGNEKFPLQLPPVPSIFPELPCQVQHAI